MAKTTADVPPQIAAEYDRAQRPSAIADATGSPGYTTTKAMQKGMQRPSQFGLPKSPPKGPQGPGLKLRISIHPDTDMDEPKLPGGKYMDKDKDKK